MKTSLAEAVSDARVEAHLEQTELAALLGIHQTAIARIETGERSLKATELLSMAALFGDWFEFRSEAVMSEIIADTAARVRTFLQDKTFDPISYAKRDWLTQALETLDHSHVGGD